MEEVEAMVKIFLDFEMNPVSGKYPEVRKICKNEIIQIGAVKLDETNEEIDSFSLYVFPQYAPDISKKIQRLTGISYDQVRESSPVETAIKVFADWCGSDYEIYAWSDNDLRQLSRELAAKKIPITSDLDYMMSHWKDYQQEFGSMFPFENLFSLINAVNITGIDFKGRAHNGLDDARNTANIYRMTQDPVRFENFRRQVLSLVKPSRAFTLGDMFDFSSIAVS